MTRTKLPMMLIISLILMSMGAIIAAAEEQEFLQQYPLMDTIGDYTTNGPIILDLQFLPPDTSLDVTSDTYLQRSFTGNDLFYVRGAQDSDGNRYIAITNVEGTSIRNFYKSTQTRKLIDKDVTWLAIKMVSDGDLSAEDGDAFIAKVDSISLDLASRASDQSESTLLKQVKTLGNTEYSPYSDTYTVLYPVQ